MEDWPNPDHDEGTTLADLDRRIDEVVKEVTAVQLELENQAMWRWAVLGLLAAIAWKVW